MDTSLRVFSPHPAGEQPSVEEWSTTADTFAGRVRVEWDGEGLVTALGQLPFFIDYLKQAGLFAGWVADCPLTFSSPNAPRRRDLLGTVLLSVLSGHYRYAHITTLRCDAVNARGCGRHDEGMVKRGRGAGAARRRLTKRRAWLGCRRTSTTASGRCSANRGCWTSIARSSRCMAARKARWWVTIRTNRVDRRTATTPT